MKKMKKTLSVTLLMLGLVSIGAGASYATKGVDVDPITAQAELYPDWTCTVDKLGAMDESTSSVIYGEVLEGDTVDELDEESPFELHEGSGIGFTLNGDAFTPESVLVPAENVVRIDLGFEAKEGDVVMVNGSFSNSDWEITVVFNNCALEFDGSAWVEYIPGVPDDGYTPYNLGKLEFHVNSTVGGAAGNNNQLYLQRADGGELPVQSWDVLFAYESGEGFKINDEVVTPAEIKSTDAGFFWMFDALEAGDVVSISGTFVCEAEAVRYTIEESKFVWNGSGWEKYIDYTTLNIGRLTYKSHADTSIDLKRVNDEDIEVATTENDLHWTTAFEFQAGSGVGVTLNGEQINMNDIKFPTFMYIGLGAKVKEGDVLVVGGTFYSKTLAYKYVIEESKFVFNGTTWETQIVYTPYEIGKLTVSSHSANAGVNAKPGFIYLDRADGQALPIQLWENPFTLESGDGLKLNGDAIAITEMQSSDAGIYLTFAEVQPGDVLSISGTFICPKQAVKYIIEESEFKWDGTVWASTTEEPETPPVKPEITYTEYDLGAVNSIVDANASSAYFKFADGVTLPVSSWDFAFDYVSGNGITVDGTMIDMVNSVKSVGDNKFFANLGAEASVGSILKIGGVFSNDETAVKYIIEDSEFKWNGTAWVSTAIVEYTTHEIGKLEFHVNTRVGDAAGNNNQLYLQRADGGELPVQTWDVLFAYESGDGFRVNGEAVTPAEIKSTEDGFFWKFGALNAGDVVSISGTFVCEAKAVKYVIEESKFLWNGTSWEYYVNYTEYDLGAVKSVRIAEGGIELLFADDVTLPISSWEFAFGYVSGNGITVDGTMISMANSVKSVENKFFVDLGDAAVSEGSLLNVGGVFSNVANAVKYIIEDSEFKWNGTAWVSTAIVEYTTYEIGKLAASIHSSDITSVNAKPGLIYLDRVDGQALPVQLWENPFTLESGDGLKLNGDAIAITEMQSSDAGIYLTFADVQEGDMLSISGTFVCHTQAVKYVIEESKFTWNGSAWESYVDYTEYDLGAVKNMKVAEGGVEFAFATDVELPISSWDFAFGYVSGNGITVDGTMINMVNSVKSVNNNFFANLGTDINVGTIVKIGGVFNNAALAVKYIIEDSEFMWNGTAWVSTAPVDYTTHEIGKLEFHVNTRVGDAAGYNNQLYLQRADGEALPVQSWDVVFSYESGDGFQVHGEAATPLVIKSTGDGFYWLFAGVKAGDVVSISGTYTCETEAAKYVIEESKFVWNGTGWEKYVEYITYDVGTLVFSSGDAQNVYFVRADGEAFEIVSTEDNINWTAAFSIRNGSGVGIKLNGVQISMDNSVKFPETMFIDLGAPAQLGDVLEIGGTFYNVELGVEYVVAKNEYTFNGTSWTDSLTAAKHFAKLDVDAYLANFSQDNYYEAQWNEINAIVASAKASIDKAGVEADLATIVATAKSDMDAVLVKAAADEVLGAARASAKAELAAYKSQADYKEAAWAEIEGIIANANATIDAAYTVEAITSAVNTAKADINKVQTAAQEDAAQLKAWRDEAKADVQAYYSALNFDLYSAEANAQLSGYVGTAISTIESATTKEAIDEAVAQFKAGVDSVEKLADKPADQPTEDSASQDEDSSVDSSAAKKGCLSVVGSSVAVSGIALAAAAVAVLRKKEDNE